MTVAPTEVGLPALEGLAYSEEPVVVEPPVLPAPTEPEPESSRWPGVAARAGLGLFLAVLIAAGIGVVGVRDHSTAPAAPAPHSTAPAAPAPHPPVSQSPVTKTAVGAPLPPPARQDPDQLFATLLAQAGITADHGSPAVASRAGHDVCDYLAEGWSKEQIVASTVANGHFVDGRSPTPGEMRTVVAAAVKAYCPQFAD